MGRSVRRPALALLLAVLMLLALAAPAQAAKPPGLITCLATPRLTLTETEPGIWSWFIRGSGACVAAGGTLTVSLIGGGQSDGLGLCGGLLVQNLVILVRTTITRVFSGQTFTALNLWTAPITTFPLATPFLVTTVPTSPDETPSTVGAGTIFSHIFLNCPDDNVARESSTVTWLQDYAGSGATQV